MSSVIDDYDYNLLGLFAVSLNHCTQLAQVDQLLVDHNARNVLACTLKYDISQE